MVHVALLARLEAKPGKEEAVAALLKGALPLANAEPATTVWFALKLGPSTFGIFDAFADESGRQAHLAGHLAVDEHRAGPRHGTLGLVSGAEHEPRGRQWG